MKPAFHSMFVSIQTGLFTLTAFSLLLKLLWRKGLSTEVKRGLDLAIGVATGLGLASILVSLITGFLVWPAEAVLNSPLLKNKILTGILLTLVFGTFLCLHLRYLPSLWERKGLRAYYAILGLGGYLLIIVTNSIGGDVAGNPSGFEMLPRLIGVETRYTFYLPTWVNLVLVGLGLAALGLGIAGQRKGRA